MEAQLAEFRNKGMMQDASISKSSNEFAFKNVNIRITAVNDNTLFSVTNEKGSEGVDIKKTEVAIPNKITFVEEAHIDQDISWRAVSQYPVASDIEIEFEHHEILETYYFYINDGENESNVIEAWDTDYPNYQNTQIDITEDDSYTYYVDGDDVPEERKVIVDQTIEGAYIGKCIIGNYLILFTKETGHDRIYRCSILDNGNLLADCIVDRDLGFAGPVETVGYYEREDIQKAYWVDGINPNRVINIVAESQPNSFDFNPEIGDIPTISVSKQYVGAGSFPGGTIQYFVSYYNKLGQETKIANATGLYYITDSDKGIKPGDTATCSFNISLSGLNTSFEYARVYSAIRSTLDGPIDARIVGDYTIPSSGTVSLVDTGRNQEAIDSSVLYYIGGDRFIASTIEDKDNVLFFGDISDTGLSLNEDEISAIKTAFANSISFKYYDTGVHVYSSAPYYLNSESNSFKHFKYNNIYKFAIQFIDSCGQYTDCVDIASLACPMPPICTGPLSASGALQQNNIYIPKACLTWSQVNTSGIQNILSRFVSYRLLIAETSPSTRVILAQGIINPMIFRIGDRINNFGPYAIPSWITRPQNTPNSRHFEVIGGHRFTDEPEGGPSRIIEQNDGSRSAEISAQRNIKSPMEGQEYNINSFYVDESKLTINSPDISYSSKIATDSVKFRIVGFTRNESKYSDYILSIEDKKNNIVKNMPLVYKYTDMDSSYKTFEIETLSGSNTLYSWNDYADGADLPLNVAGTSSSPTTDNYEAISIWHNSGYIGYFSGYNILKHKLYSIYKYCTKTAYFDSPILYNGTDISYGSESVFKLGDKKICGDYDNLIIPTSAYSPFIPNRHQQEWWWADGFNQTTKRNAINHTDPIRIKVKFTDFIAVNLGEQYILPYITGITQQWALNKIYSTGTYGRPVWGGSDVSLINQQSKSPTVFCMNNNQGASSADILSGHQDLGQGSFTYEAIQQNISLGNKTIDYNTKLLFIGELYKDIPGNTIAEKADVLYGSSENIKWLPCGKIHEIGDSTAPSETEGDTYFQRWDCLRAYPYTEEDENSVVDIVSFMVETYQNLDTRYDSNRGYENMNYARPQNYGLFNSAYNQANNIFKYNTIEERLQYQNFPQQFAWSLNKSTASEIDAWTSATLSNIYNTDGSYGPINAIEKLNDTLIGFQDRAIFVINFNNRTQISTEQGLPIELANSGKVDGITYLTRHYGCKNKYSIVSTKTGLYFIDDENRAFVNISKDGIADITASSGMSVWFEKQASYNKKWAGGDIADYSAFVVGYDSNRGDIYIMNGIDTDEGCLVYNETLKTFTSFFNVQSTSYRFPLMYNFNGETYGLDGADNSFNKLFGGTYDYNYSVEYRVNPEPLIGKIFTNIDYIADVYDTEKGVDDAMSLANISISQPFDEISVFNEYQQKINVPLTENKWLQPTNATMFRIRHAEIPSTGTYGIDRMHNPWIHLKLNGNTKRALMQFHSLTVKYFK